MNRIVTSLLVIGGAALSPAHGQQFTISTFAGAAPSATPLPAVSAPIRAPQAVATDASGNLYIAEFNRVSRVSRHGILTIVAGTGVPGYSGDDGPATSAQLFLRFGLNDGYPGGLAADSVGNVYISDNGNSRVRKVSTAGIITTIAAGLRPAGLAVDSDDNLYIADLTNYQVRKVTPAGVVTVVAGNGSGFYTGDGGPATSAGLRAPFGLAVDRHGNLYIAGGYRIRKVSPDGIITTVAGNGVAGNSGDGGPAISAMLNCPTLEVAVDASGNLFFADFDYHWDSDRIRKVSTDGIITTVAGTGTPGDSGDGGPAASAQLHGAVGVAVDSAGALYIADRFNNRVRKVSLDGIITTFAGIGFGDDGPATRAQFSFVPWGGGMAIDNGGNLYIADTENFRVRRISPDGLITTFAGTGPPDPYPAPLGDGGPATHAQLEYPQQVAVDGAGNLFVNNRKVSPDGIITSVYAYGRALAVDSAGNLYFISGTNDDCDYEEGRIIKISPAGIETPVAGGCSLSLGDGGPATSAQLGYPFALALDGADNLYIADIRTNRVRKVSPDGIITTVAGNGTAGFSGDGGPAGNAQINAPVALTTDAAGNLFIADSYNNRIRMVSAVGIITTVAGDGTQGYSGDGGLATSAQFGSVSGLAVDRSGDLYVSDQFYNAVRLLRPVGSSTNGARKE